MRLLHEYLMRISAVSFLALAMPTVAMAQGLEPTSLERDAAKADAGTAMDQAPVAVEPGAPVALAGYEKGFFIKSEDGRFGLKLQGRVQTRYTFESELDPLTDERAEASSFAIQRARLTLSGHAFEEGLKYKFQSDYGKGFVSLKDFYIDYKVGSQARIRVGQFKRPFSRQQITSSGRQALIDRTITDKFFQAGRDIGVALHNNYEKSPELEWAVGVFNGTGDKPVFDVDGFSNVPERFGPAFVARVGYNQGGIKGYSEADLEGGPLRYGVGASALTELDVDGDDASGVRAELDYIVKASGLSSTGGVYVATAQDGEGFADQAYDAVGFHLQAGYMLTDTHQLVGRYAMISPDGADSLQEVTLGYSMYQFKHNFKWQTDASALVADGGALGDALRVRTQLQLSF